MKIQRFQKTCLFKVFLFLMIFFWVSCVSSKYKESTKEKDIQQFSFIDTTKLKLQSSGSLTTINQNKNFTITKKDTIIKIDSLYFYITTEETVYSEGSQTIIHDTAFIKEEQKAIKIDSSSQTEKETNIKKKKVNSNLFYLLIPLFLGIYLLYKKFFKK